jgi:hypothetical protein
MSLTSNRPRHRRSKAAIAALTGLAALIGGAQAFAAAPALAAGASPGPQPCSTVSWFDWFSCVTSTEDGGGGSGSSGGEVIRVSGVAPKQKCDEEGVVCVEIGTRKQGAPDLDSRPRREGAGRGQLQSGGIDRGRPSCTEPSRGKEAGVCPNPSKPQKEGKPQKPKDPLTQGLEQARRCQGIARKLTTLKRWRKDAETGLVEDSPRLFGADRQEWIEMLDLMIGDEQADWRKNGCDRQLQI